MNQPTIDEVHHQFCITNNKKYNKKNLKKDLSWNCFAVASVLAEMLKKQNIKARAVYGTWKGTCVSKKEKGFFRHGWVLINEKDILDPTRWVFEDSSPMIFEGTVKKNKEYDEGMTQLRSLISRPFPKFNPEANRIIKFKWSESCASVIEWLSGCDCKAEQNMTVEQAMWMANLPPNLWSCHLDEIYGNLTKEGFAAFIPMDYKEKWKANKEMVRS
jgi:hypothetical protein